MVVTSFSTRRTSSSPDMTFPSTSSTCTPYATQRQLRTGWKILTHGFELLLPANRAAITNTVAKVAVHRVAQPVAVWAGALLSFFGKDSEDRWF
jgi:hypothetical protein